MLVAAACGGAPRSQATAPGPSAAVTVASSRISRGDRALRDIDDWRAKTQRPRALLVTVIARAREKAIAEYTALAAEAPRYAHLDEVLYMRGLEREAGGDDAGAAVDYEAVLRDFPSSRAASYAAYGMGVITSRVAPDLRALARRYFEEAEQSSSQPLAAAARAAAE
jgi:hypothetical protein